MKLFAILSKQKEVDMDILVISHDKMTLTIKNLKIREDL